jgi:hypothetical protein
MKFETLILIMIAKNISLEKLNRIGGSGKLAYNVLEIAICLNKYGVSLHKYRSPSTGFAIHELIASDTTLEYVTLIL